MDKYDEIFAECEFLKSLPDTHASPHTGKRRRQTSASELTSDSPMKRTYVVPNQSTTEEEEF